MSLYNFWNECCLKCCIQLPASRELYLYCSCCKKLSNHHYQAVVTSEPVPIKPHVSARSSAIMTEAGMTKYKSFAFPQFGAQADFVPHTHLLSKMLTQEDTNHCVAASQREGRTFPDRNTSRSLSQLVTSSTALKDEKKSLDVTKLAHTLLIAPQPRLELYPTVDLSLFYDVQCRNLYVSLHKVHNLPGKHLRGTNGHFVSLHLEPDRSEVYQSQVRMTLNPLFNETFHFNISFDQVKQQTLVLLVYYCDKKSKDDYVGSVRLPLSKSDLLYVKQTVHINEVKLKTDACGYLQLSLQFVPHLRELRGVLLKATDLPQKYFNGFADPFVKVYLRHNGQTVMKWKSRIKKKTLMPVFNEAFRFDISTMVASDQASLEFVVVDFDRLCRNDIIGSVVIGNQCGHKWGERYWKEVISSPETNITHWHTIMPPTSQ